MAESQRAVVVRLRAEVEDYKRAMKAAGASTENVGKDATKAEKQATTAFGRMSQSIEKNKAAYATVGPVLLGIGAAAAAGVGVAVKAFADFDQAMSNTAALGDDAAGSIDLLREAAMQAGRDTAFSAKEAALGVTELMKAGVASADVLGGGLTGALDLAAAGELGVADAARIAATTMTQFGLAGEDVTTVADAFASAANNAQGSVEDVSKAMEYAGVPAAALGVSMEETTGVIALFAKSGIVGEKAGTAFRGMLVQMQKPTSQSATLMEELNLQFFDAQGQFVGMEGVAGQLQTRLSGLTDEQRGSTLATIFGSEALGAATALYNGGGQAVADWTETVSQSGYASEVAATKLDNLAGDLKILQGSFETALISLGAGADGPLRSMTQGLTGVVNTVGALSPAAQTAALAVGGTVAAVGLLGGGFLVLAPRILATKTALATMGISARTAAISVGVAGGALTVATVGLTAWASAQAEAAANVAALAETLDATTGALTEMSEENIRASLSAGKTWLGFLKVSDSAYDNAEKLGIGLDLVTEAASGNADAMVEVNDLLNTGTLGSKSFEDALKRTGLTSGEYAAAQGQLQDALKGSNGTLDEAVKVTLQKRDADAVSATGQKELADGYDFTTGAVEGQTDALDDLIKSQATAAGVVMSERDAQRSLEAAIDDATDALKENGKTLDITTEKGRANQAALDDISSSGWDLIESMKANGASQAAIQATMATTRERFLQVAQKMGMGSDAAVELANKLGLIPENVRSQVQIDTEAADKALQAFLNKNRKITVGTGFAGKDSKLVAATGGAISGPGSGTSDDIPAWLSNGEHVFTSSEVEKAGGQDAIYRMRQDIRSGALKYAQGGHVSLNPIKDVRVPVSVDTSGAQSGLDSYARANTVPRGSGGYGGVVDHAGSRGGYANLVAFGRLLQRMDFRVGEHPAFGGVRGRHMNGSKHYRGMAIDVNKYAGTSRAEQVALAGIIPLSKAFGLGNIFMKAGHYGHAHFEAYKNGGAVKRAGVARSITRATGGAVARPAWQSTPARTAGYATATASVAPAGPTVITNMSGTYYSYDPHDITRAANNQMRDAMAAYGIGR